MSEISTEMLMAYADGELPERDRLRVESYVASNPEAQKQLAAFASTGTVLAELFDQPMREPVPQHLVDAIMTASVRDANVIGLNTRRRTSPFSPSSFAPSQWAIAATVAGLLVAGAGASWMHKYGPAGLDASVGLVAASDGNAKFAAGALASVLENGKSGGTAELTISGATAKVKPVFTFATAGNGYCRQYQINRTETSALVGVACRNVDGRWRIEAHVPFEGDRSRGDEIVPAGKATQVAIDATVDRMIFGDVLGPEDEARVIGGHWQGDTSGGAGTDGARP